MSIHAAVVDGECEGVTPCWGESATAAKGHDADVLELR
jgi:hypothetical protein